jgi:TolB-like protein
MAPSAEDVRRQLDRVLASPVFANAGRMSRFLKFIVEQTLTGEGERLKEYVIGVEVFDRDASYDPRLDAIVRVEASRLRSKLAEYYAGDGRGDAVVLSLPKGGYAAAIAYAERPSWRSARPTGWLLGGLLAGVAALTVAAWAPWTAAPESKPRIAVLPFTAYPDEAGDDAKTVATRLTEGVTAELVRADRFAVVASSAALGAHATRGRLRDVAAALDADVLVEAHVTSDGARLRVEARAAIGPLEQKFWVGDFTGDAADSDALEREIAGAITAALADARRD